MLAHAEAAIGDRSARAYGKETTVRQSISLNNLAGLRSLVGHAQTEPASPHSPRPRPSPLSPLGTPEDRTCENTVTTPRNHQSAFARCPSAPLRSFHACDRTWSLPVVADDATSSPLRSYAILSEPPGSAAAEDLNTLNTPTPSLPATPVLAPSQSWTVGEAISNVTQSASPYLSHNIWVWLRGQTAATAGPASAPAAPSSPDFPQLVRSASEVPPQVATPRSQGSFSANKSDVPIPIARYQTPPPGYHEQFWPQTLSDSTNSMPCTPQASPRRGLQSLRCQSSCTPRSQPIDVQDECCSELSTGQGAGSVIALQSAGLTCRVHGQRGPAPRPQSAPSGTPKAALPSSPSTGLWTSWQWASLPQASRGVTSVDSSSVVSESGNVPAGVRHVSRRSTAVKPLDSFPLSRDDFEDCRDIAEAVVACEAVLSTVNAAAQQPSMFESLVTAMFGQDAPPGSDTVTPCEGPSSGEADSECALRMPEGAREGKGSTAGILKTVPDHMMFELAAMFDEPWAVKAVGSRTSVPLGVGERSILGPASNGKPGCTMEHVWSHHDRLLNVSFNLERQQLRDGLFAYHSRLRVYGSSAVNACTFMLHDDVIKSGNPTILSYDRLEDPGADGSMFDGSHCVTNGFAESGILHSCIKMPGFLKTRQYVACRRVWKWDDQPQCLIVSIPFQHPQSQELCKGKGIVAEDFRMGYVVRCASMLNFNVTQLSISASCLGSGCLILWMLRCSCRAGHSQMRVVQELRFVPCVSKILASCRLLPMD